MQRRWFPALAALVLLLPAGNGAARGWQRGHPARLADSVRAYIDEYGIEPLPGPPSVSSALFELGQALAFDKILSGNRNISCMTCHHPAVGTDDDRHLPLGEGGAGLGEGRVGGHVIPRNAPALFNLHAFDSMFWDSRVELDANGELSTPAGNQLSAEMALTLELGVVAAQALFPVTSRHEMRGFPGENEIGDRADDDLSGIWADLMARLGAIPEYVALFEAAYPGESFAGMTFAHAANAIAAFEVAAFDARNSRWERFVAGDDRALRPSQLRGALTFFEVGCAECHNGGALSDFQHHNTGLAQFGPGKGDGATGGDDFGRERVTGDPGDRYRFRTPPLFNVELTGPYGHDGQFRTLRGHIEHYIAPEEALESYDITRHVVEKDLWGMVEDNTDAVLMSLDPALDDLDFGHTRGGARAQARRIRWFLKALSDPASRHLEWTVPDSVPSGLPVAD